MIWYFILFETLDIIKPIFISLTIKSQHNLIFQKPLVAVLTNLKKYTRYRIVVQAYNRIGAGPRNQDLIVSTAEDGIESKFIFHLPLKNDFLQKNKDNSFLVFINIFYTL